jgi:transposase
MGRVKDITPKKTVVIVSYSKDGLSCRDIARKLGVSKSAVAYVIKRQNESGSFTCIAVMQVFPVTLQTDLQSLNAV